MIGVLVNFLLFLATASDLDIAKKLYGEGIYYPAEQILLKTLKTSPPETFEKFEDILIDASFKAEGKEGIKKVVDLMEKKLKGKKSGKLLALKFYISGNEKILEKLSELPLIREKEDFFRTLSKFDLPSELIYKVLVKSSSDVELKGALVKSGFLEKSLEVSTKERKQEILDVIFENFGRWFEKPEERLAFVRYLVRKGRLKSALAEIESLLKDFQSEEARYEYAKILFLNGNYQKAVEVLGSPQTEKEKYLKAWCLLKLGRGREALKTLGVEVSKPEVPKILKALLSYYRFEETEELKEFPELYSKFLAVSFKNEVPSSCSNIFCAVSCIENMRLECAVEVLKKLNSVDAKYLLSRLLPQDPELFQEITASHKEPYYSLSLYEAGKNFFLSGSYNVGLKLLEFSYEKRPTPEKQKLLGIFYLISGKDDQSVKLLKDFKKDPEAMFYLATAYYRTGEREKSFKILEKLVQSSDYLREISEMRLLYLAKLLKKEVRKLNITTPEGITALAVSFHDFSKSIKNFNLLSPEQKSVVAYAFWKTNGKNNPSKALGLLAKSYNFASGELAEFLKSFMRFAGYESGLAEVVLLEDEKFLAFNPELSIASVQQLISRAEEYEERKEFRKARELYKIALNRSISPELKRAVVSKIVHIDVKLEGEEKALEDIERFLGESDYSHYLKFKVFLESGRFVPALEAVLKIKNVDSLPVKDRATVYAKLFEYYKLSGKDEKAKEVARKILNLKNLEYVGYDGLIELAIFCQDKGLLKEAETFARASLKCAKNKKQRAEAKFWLASILKDEGKLEKAMEVYLSVWYEEKVNPWAITSLYRAGEVLEELGKLEDALKVFQKVASLKKGTKEGKIAEERVKSLIKRLGRGKYGKEEQVLETSQ